MPDVDPQLWNDIADALRGPVLHVVIIVDRRPDRDAAGDGVDPRGGQAVLDRQATEGTSRDLSAVEIEKRIKTLGGLGAAIARTFIAVIAGLMVFHELDSTSGRRSRGWGSCGIAVGFGAQSLVERLLQRARSILIENQFRRATS